MPAAMWLANLPILLILVTAAALLTIMARDGRRHRQSTEALTSSRRARR